MSPIQWAMLVAVVAGCGRLEFGSSSPDAPADGSTLLASCEARYMMEEPTWVGTAVDDSCGTNHGLALNGAVRVDDEERGRVGELVGGSSCITVADAPGLRGGGALSIAAWVKPTQLTPGGFGIVSKRVDFMNSTEYSVFLWTSGGGTGPDNHLYVDIDGEAERFEHPVDTFLGSWRHVLVVFDGQRAALERIAIYVDGEFRGFGLEASASIPPAAIPPSVSIGCLPLGGPAQALVGRIDDVVIWSRTLDASEVAAWYATTK